VVASSASVELAPAARQKAALRAAMGERLRAVGAGDRLRAGRTASSTLLSLLDATVATGAPVALYAATPTELACEDAVGSLSARHPLLFPRLDDDRLVFAEASPARLERGRSGLLEPPPSAPIRTPSVVVVPGRAFDLGGFRLGRGAGHYDRALRALSPGVPLVGFAYSFQVVDLLPAEPHDVPVHVVVTEAGEPLHRRPEAVPHAPPTASTSPASMYD
jgi:5-formyltetrahydrofolate cyclo-ligase